MSTDLFPSPSSSKTSWSYKDDTSEHRTHASLGAFNSLNVQQNQWKSGMKLFIVKSVKSSTLWDWNNMEPSLPQTLPVRLGGGCGQNQAEGGDAMLPEPAHCARDLKCGEGRDLPSPLGISTRSCAATQSCRFSRSTRSLRCFGKHFHFGLEKSRLGKQSSDLYVTLPRTEHSTLSLGQVLHGFIVSRPEILFECADLNGWKQGPSAPNVRPKNTVKVSCFCQFDYMSVTQIAEMKEGLSCLNCAWTQALGWMQFHIST